MLLDTYCLKEVTPEWKAFGRQLGISHVTIKEIDESSNMAFSDLLDQWVDSNRERATMGNIIAALRAIDNHRLADKLTQMTVGETHIDMEY